MQTLLKNLFYLLALIIIILGFYPDYIMSFMNMSLQNISSNIIIKL